MKKNVGIVDKVLRIAMAFLVPTLYMMDVISGTALLVISGVLAVTFLATALSGYCPMYTLFGFTSCPVKDQEEETA